MLNFPPHFAQVLGCGAVVLAARHAVDKCQHLIFCFNKLRFARTYKETDREGFINDSAVQVGNGKFNSNLSLLFEFNVW